LPIILLENSINVDGAVLLTGWRSLV